MLPDILSDRLEVRAVDRVTGLYATYYTDDKNLCELLEALVLSDMQIKEVSRIYEYHC